MYTGSSPSSSEPWLANANFLISAILLIPALGSFLYTVAKERGKPAKAARIFEESKKQIDVAEAALRIRERILEGDRLAEAKAEALDKVHEIERVMKMNLAENATRNLSVPVIGVANWRIALGLYKPVTHDRARSVMMRVVFLYSLVILFLAVPLAILLAHRTTVTTIWYWSLDHRHPMTSEKPFLTFALVLDLVNVCLYRYGISKESRTFVKKLWR